MEDDEDFWINCMAGEDDGEDDDEGHRDLDDWHDEWERDTFGDKS